MNPHSERLRIVVHDFSGHPFQLDLSRQLAERGYQVLHVHCSSYSSGKGSLEQHDHLQIIGIGVGGEFRRYSPYHRLRQELVYGFRFIRVAQQFKPDFVISCNDPLLSKVVSSMWCWLRRIPWLFWLQDLYSIAIAEELEKRRFPLARAACVLVQLIERGLLRLANVVVPITDDFLPRLAKWGIQNEKCRVIENWAPISELPLHSRENAWRHEHGIGNRALFLYSGTLGLKHDPESLYHLAKHVSPSGALVIVISEGIGIDRLSTLQSESPLANLWLFPFQPYHRLSEVLAAADVLVVLLEREASLFSVPSKVLTYLCAGRPILGLMPAGNLAARTVIRAGAGIVVEPGELDALRGAADTLLDDKVLRQNMGNRGRAYAEETFDSRAIADQFEDLIGMWRPSYKQSRI